MKSQTSLKMGKVGSKTRSVGQILEKPCVRSRCHIFCLIIMKLGQNVCFGEISDDFENRHVGSKTKSIGQMFEKKPCVCSKGHNFSQINMKLGQNVFLDKISD